MWMATLNFIMNVSRQRLNRLLIRSSHCWCLYATSAVELTKRIQHPRYWQRSTYKYFLPIQTRWMDNDQYLHVNNTIYFSFFGTAVGHFLINKCGLNTDLKTSTCVGYIVDTQCTFRSSIRYPETALCGLGIVHIGNSSVQYVIGAFGESEESSAESSGRDKTYRDEASAVGYIVHAFVNPQTRSSVVLSGKFREQVDEIFLP